MDHALSLYRQLISTPELLKQGESLLLQEISKNPQFLAHSLEIVCTPSISIQERTYISAILRNLVKAVWHVGAVDAIKANFRVGIVKGVAGNISSRKVVEGLGLIISELVIRDGVEGDWQSYLHELVGFLQPQADNLENLLELFSILFSKVDNRINFLVPALLPKLLEIHQTRPNEHNLVLVYLAIFSITHLESCDDELLRKCLEPVFKPFFSSFMQILSTDIRENIALKRYIVKILTILFRDMPEYSRKSLEIGMKELYEFLAKLMPLYVMNVVYGIEVASLDVNLKPVSGYKLVSKQENPNTLDFDYFEQEIDFNSDVEGLALQSLEMLSTVASKQEYEFVTYGNLYTIFNLCFNFMLVTKLQEEQYRSDPNQYISEDEDEASLASIRNLCLNLITELVENNHEKAFPVLFALTCKFLDYGVSSEQILANFPSYLQSLKKKSSNMLSFTGENMLALLQASELTFSDPVLSDKQKESALLVLGTLSEDFLTFHDPNITFEPSNLIKTLVSHLQNQNSSIVLKGRALWTISKVCYLLEENYSQLVLDLLTLVTNEFLTDKNALPTRLIAARSIGIYASKIKEFNCVEKIAVDLLCIVDTLFAMLSQTSEETVHIVLDTIFSLNKLSSGCVERCGEIGASQFLQVFQMFHNEVMIGKITQDIIGQICGNEKARVHIYNAFIPFICTCLDIYENSLKNKASNVKPEDITMLSNLLDVLSVFIRNKAFDGNSEEILRIVRNLLGVALEQKNDGAEILMHVGLCLEGLVGNYSQVFTGHEDQIFKVVENMLSNDEASAFGAGNLVLLSAKRLRNDVFDQSIILKAVEKLSKCTMPSVIQNLVLIFAKMLITHPSESIDFLHSLNTQSGNGLKVVLGKWALAYPLFNGKKQLDLINYAMIKLISLRNPTIEALNIAGYKSTLMSFDDEVNAVVRLMACLVKSAKNQPKKSAEEEWEDVDEPLGGNGFVDYGAFDYDNQVFADSPMEEVNDYALEIALENQPEILQGVDISEGIRAMDKEYLTQIHSNLPKTEADSLKQLLHC